MIDVQSKIDNRNVYINKVGIKGLILPVEIHTIDNNFNTPVEFDLGVSLASDRRGTHMSRFVEIIQDIDYIDIRKLNELAIIICDKLDSTSSYINMKFQYFTKKKAPISEKESFLNIDVECSINYSKEDIRQTITIKVPITTLCPCSKEISMYNAHNQRACVRLTLENIYDYSIEKLIKIVEKASSSTIYPLLKRMDEKEVTEKAYENPKFVEDVSRDIKILVDEKYKEASYYRIEVESFESIHNHSAISTIYGGCNEI